jgi:hypothetical protein
MGTPKGMLKAWTEYSSSLHVQCPDLACSRSLRSPQQHTESVSNVSRIWEPPTHKNKTQQTNMVLFNLGLLEYCRGLVCLGVVLGAVVLLLGGWFLFFWVGLGCVLGPCLEGVPSSWFRVCEHPSHRHWILGQRLSRGVDVCCRVCD